MGTEVKQLLLEALKLSTEDRTELATELLASLTNRVTETTSRTRGPLK